MKLLNPLKHIKDNLDHAFNWSVLANAPEYVSTKSPRGILHCSRKAYS